MSIWASVSVSLNLNGPQRPLAPIPMGLHLIGPPCHCSYLRPLCPQELKVLYPLMKPELYCTTLW